MIVDKKFSVQEEVDGDFEGIDASLSLEDMDLIFSIVSENFYSDITGSIVRELASNCVDSHTEAKVTDPIVIKYSDIEGQEFISFIDVGTGLNPERFEHIYMRYFKSTKRESNEYVGFFGIGSKSPLGYTDSFEVITKADGIEYYYVVGKSESGKPRADLLSSKPTSERNGTEVRIAINQGDYEKFRKAIKKQLIYFDNVYVDGFDVDNGFNVVEADSFRYRYSLTSSEEHPYDSLHISFGKVVYPITWKEIGREEIKIPLGIKFDIGELKVTNNREQIVYTDLSRELINNRIDIVLEEVRNIYNKQNSTELNLKEYLKQRNQPTKYVKLGYKEVPLPTKTVLKEDSSYEYIHVDVIEGLNIGNYKPFIGTPLIVPDEPFFNFGIIDKLDEVRIRKRKLQPVRSDIKSDDLDNLFRYRNISRSAYYILKDKNNRNNKVDKYIVHKETTEDSSIRNCYILQSRKLKYDDYVYALNLNGDKKEIKDIRSKRLEYYRRIRETEDLVSPTTIKSIKAIPIITDKWNKTKLIQYYKQIMNTELEEATKSYDSLPQSFEYKLYLESIKKKRVVIRQEGIINAYCMDRSSDIKLKLSSLEKFTGIILYSYKGDSKRLRPLYEAVSMTNKIARATGGKSIRGYLVGKSFFKHFKNNPYFMSVDEFLSNGNSIIQKMVTAKIVSERYSSVVSLTGELTSHIEELSPQIHQLEKDLKSFTDKYIRSIYSLKNSNEELLNEMVNIVVSNNWVIPHYIQDLEPIEKFYNELELFRYIDKSAFSESIGKQRVVEYLKMKNKKLDPIYYFVPTKEEQKILDDAKELVKYKKELVKMREDLPFSYRHGRNSLHDSPYFR